MIYKDPFDDDVEYPSFSEMCIVYGKNPSNVKYLLSKGKSLGEALSADTRVNSQILEAFDKKFTSYRELAKFFNINYSSVLYGAKKGEDLEHLITRLKSNNKGQFIEYKGKEYKNIDELCNEYKVDKRTFVKRRMQGATLEDIFGGADNNE